MASRTRAGRAASQAKIKISFVTLWNYLNRPQRTPQTTIEAIMYVVRERGVAALKEPANIERLLLCDDAARTEINERIGRLIAAKEIAT
jgi:hypothetical protein